MSIHLAALQVPFCRADPVRGARVNVVGTVCVFEAAKQRELGTPIAYASSAAVYDRSGAMSPTTIYGVYKVCERGHGAHLLGGVRRRQRRPAAVLRVRAGPRPGTDRRADARHAGCRRRRAVRHLLRRPHGTALRAGRGAGARLAARSPADSAEVYDMSGEPVHMSEVVSAIEAAAPDAEVTPRRRAAPVPRRAPRSALRRLR